MVYITKGFATALASGAMILSVCSFASAIDIGDRSSGLGVSVDVDTSNGIGVDVGATVGGGNGVNADASANVGGSQAVDVDATASVGGANGVNGDVDVDVGGTGGTGADVDVSVGGGGTGGTGGIGVGVTPNAPGTDVAGPTVPDRAKPGVRGPLKPSMVGIPGLIASMSQSDLVKYRKLCSQVMSDGGGDAALRELCALLQTASR